MSTSQLEQENSRLKNEVNTLQQQLNNCQKQIVSLKQQIQSTPKLLKTKTSTNNNNKNSNDSNTKIERVINRNDAKSALMAKFAVSSPDLLKMAQNNNQNNSVSFKKYETMLKVGVDLSGVITQMNKDNIDSSLIDKFKISHGMKPESDSASNIDINAPKFSKYHRMKKLRMPIKTITNKMKLDGLSKEEIDAFSGKGTGSSSSTDPIQMAEQLGLPKKPTIPKPVNQMKRVHWEPVGLKKIKTSIWDNIDHEWFDYDPIMFELNFQTRKRKEKIQTDALQGNVTNASQQNDEKQQEENANFVDAKRSQMVQIGLRSFNMTNEELRDTILCLDEKKLDVDHLTSLIDIVPSPEEQIQAEKASEDTEIKYFGVVERFFYSVYDIVELRQRLQKWLFKRQFMEKCLEIEHQIDIIDEGKLTILRSHNLKEIFGILLAFGNHMNYGNKKGNAYGFHLDGLSLLPQIKTTDNSMTFPMFLWAFIKKKYPKLTRILQEFQSVAAASRVAVDVIEKEYKKLQHEMKDLNGMITRYKEEYFELIDLEDMFLNDMAAFIVMGEKRMDELKNKMNNLRKSEKQLIDFFAYDTGKENGEKSRNISLNGIFKEVYTFIEMLSVSKKKVKELERENKKRQMREERKLKKKKTRRANTEHLTRNRFQEILSKSKEKKKKEKKHHRKHKHSRKHLADKYKLRVQNATNDDTENKEIDDENKENNDNDNGILQIETITLGDAVKKRGKSRKSGYYDRTKHSSFELFKRSHSKKKNIRFKDDTDTDSKDGSNKNEDDNNKKHKHVRKQTRDDNSLDQYIQRGLLQNNNDSDSDDDDDDVEDIGIPGLFKSKSLHKLKVANTINIPSTIDDGDGDDQETDKKNKKKDVGKVDTLNVQRVRFDEDGKIHTLPTSLSMQHLMMITPRSDDKKNDDDSPESPDITNEVDHGSISPESLGNNINNTAMNISLNAQSLLDVSVKRRNSDPGTPLTATSTITRQRTDSGSRKPIIAPSLTAPSNSYDDENAIEGDDGIDDEEFGAVVIEDDGAMNAGLCIIEDYDDDDDNDDDKKESEQQLPDTSYPTLGGGVDRTSNIRLNLHKKSGSNINKHKGKKKNVKTDKKSGKKKGKNKKKTQQRSKSKPAPSTPTTQAKSTRAADDWNATFF